jgi:hypothetical protein
VRALRDILAGCDLGSDLLDRAGEFGAGRCREGRHKAVSTGADQSIRDGHANRMRPDQNFARLQLGMGTSRHCSTLGGPGSRNWISLMVDASLKGGVFFPWVFVHPLSSAAAVRTRKIAHRPLRRGILPHVAAGMIRA